MFKKNVLWVHHGTYIKGELSTNSNTELAWLANFYRPDSGYFQRSYEAYIRVAHQLWSTEEDPGPKCTVATPMNYQREIAEQFLLNEKYAKRGLPDFYLTTVQRSSLSDSIPDEKVLIEDPSSPVRV